MVENPEFGPILSQTYYARPTLQVARALIGQIVALKSGRSLTAGMIVETEAYVGQDDPACHAHRGRTPRNEVMFGPPGQAYVYFTYGNHFMLNFVTEREGFPAAVLIRGLEPVHGLAGMKKRRGVTDENKLCRGPGNLTRALGIDRSHNGLPLQGPQLTVCRGRSRRLAVATGGRIGVNEGWEKTWRFFVEDHPCVSAYRRGPKAHEYER